MKYPLIPVILLTFTLSQLSAQSPGPVSPYYDFTVGYSGQFNAGDANSVGSMTGTSGFFGAFNYGLSIRRTTFLTTAYMKFHASTDYNSYKSIWETKDFVLDKFTSGEFFSTGILIGGRFAAIDPVAAQIPQFYVFLQAGICNTIVPEMEIEYHTTDIDGNEEPFNSSFNGSRAVGTSLNFGAQADVLKTSTSTGNIKLGILHERANVFREYYSIIDGDLRAGSESFDWNTFSVYLGFSLSF